MSEHDYWQVESSVYGGVGYAPATLEEYVVIAKALDDEAAGFAAIATGLGIGRITVAVTSA